MTKQISLVEFNGVASAKMQYDDGSRSRETWHVVSMQSWVERALEKGIKVEATGKSAKARLVDILGTIPLPEEEKPKTITRYGLKMKGGMKSFVSYAAAAAHYEKHCVRFGYPMSIKEVEVKA